MKVRSYSEQRTEVHRVWFGGSTEVERQQLGDNTKKRITSFLLLSVFSTSLILSRGNQRNHLYD